MNAIDGQQGHGTNAPDGVMQLRVVVEVDDFDDAIAFYRDHLGMPAEFIVDSGDDARVIALQAGRATLELVTPNQRRLIDQLEVGRDVSPASASPSRSPMSTPQRTG